MDHLCRGRLRQFCHPRAKRLNHDAVWEPKDVSDPLQVSAFSSNVSTLEAAVSQVRKAFNVQPFQPSLRCRSWPNLGNAAPFETLRILPEQTKRLSTSSKTSSVTGKEAALANLF